ncbi:MAG: hypothetical protein AAB510_02150 [Patescibacteria group bacterium]
MDKENKVEVKKKWWQYKKMGGREIGITALILIFLGVFQLLDEGNGSLIGIGILFVIAWIYTKIRAKPGNKKEN